MADTKVVTKSLAGMEDMSIGVGTTQQNRAGTVVDIHRLHLFVPVSTENALANLDPSKFTLGVVVKDLLTTYYQYTTRAGATGISSYDGIGVWEVIRLGNADPSSYNRLVSFEAGNTLTYANDVLLLESSGDYYQWEGVLPKVVPAGSTPASTGGIGPGAWVNKGDASLRNDLSLSTGSYLSGFRQTTVGARLATEVKITDFGGGESVLDNLAAFNLAKAAAGLGGSVYLPRNSTGNYNFPTGFPDFSGIVVRPDNGVTIIGPATPGMAVSSIVTDNDYRVYFNGGDPKDYYVDIRANYHIGSKGANKSLWLNTLDIPDNQPLAVMASAIPVKQFTLGVGDTVTTVSPAGRSASSLFLQPPSGGNTQLGVIQAIPGTELKVGVNNIPDNGGEIAVGIIANTGYAVLRGQPGSTAWSLTVKYIGQPSTTQGVVAPVNIATYSAGNNLLTVRSISPIRAQFMVNGVTVVDFQLTSGAIQWMGVGSTSISATSGANFTGWFKQSFRVAVGVRSQTLGIIGDSISDGSVHGAWPIWAAEALDGSLGIRINTVENRAISGQTLDQQIANLASNPFVNASVVAVFIGTNDIQGGNSLSAFQTSLTNLINTLKSQGRAVVLVIPPQWYLKTDTAGGGGGSTTNSSKGGDIRAAIGRTAADVGLQLIDMTAFTGPVDPGYLSSTFADAILRDNMHPTAYAYRMYGYEIARGIAAQLCPVVKSPTDWVSFTTFSAGVTGTAQYRYTKEGVELRGKLEAAAALTGTIFTIPEGIRPATTPRYFIQWGNTGSIPTVVNTDGTVAVHNNPASTQISLDGLVITF